MNSNARRSAKLGRIAGTRARSIYLSGTCVPSYIRSISYTQVRVTRLSITQLARLTPSVL